MNSLASVAPQLGPLPTIQCQYRSVATSPRGRLSARADADGTVYLEFHPRTPRAGRRSLSGRWRAGPLRSCHLIFNALGHGLSLLGEQPSLERSLQLSRLIDRPLSLRLAQYVSLNDGHYEAVASHVTFVEPPRLRMDSVLPLPIGWLAASVAGVTFRTCDEASENPVSHAERETFVLLRHQKRWELWARMERANSGSMPCRRQYCLCTTQVLPEEPALAAELLLFATLARGRRAVELSACPSGLIAPDRLELIELRLRQLAGQ
ncbi:MAG: hypothetical protein WDO68_31675 [Gammaproteobacteria bacterium]